MIVKVYGRVTHRLKRADGASSRRVRLQQMSDRSVPILPYPRCWQTLPRETQARGRLTLKPTAQYLQQYSQQARANGLNPNDLVDTTTACGITCYFASTGQSTTPVQDAGVRRKVRSNMLTNAEFQGATAAEKQQIRDALGIITVATVKGMQGNPQEQTETRQTAEQMFTFLVGYAPDRAQLTSNRFQPR